MTTWMISCSTNSITLPMNPNKTSITHTANYKELSYPTKRSLVIALGKKVDRAIVEGTLFQAGLTADNIYNHYLSPVSGMVSWVYKNITISSSVIQFSGSWILSNLEYSYEGGYTTSYKYRMELIRGVNAAGVEPGVVVT